MGGGTEAFPDLGHHCDHPDCRQLDFLPFTCDACHKAFCLDHRSYDSHECPNADAGSRTVVVCEICSSAIETTGEGEKKAVERHERSGECDPTKKKKPTFPVRRCKQVLTFSNTATCKTCGVKICLRHRFPADHACAQLKLPAGSPGNKFLAALAARSGKECSSKIAASNTQHTVKAW